MENPVDNIEITIKAGVLRRPVEKVKTLTAQAPTPRLLEPTEPGAYNGDEFFGDPENTARVTHVWRNDTWHLLPQMPWDKGAKPKRYSTQDRIKEIRQQAEIHGFRLVPTASPFLGSDDLEEIRKEVAREAEALDCVLVPKEEYDRIWLALQEANDKLNNTNGE